MGIKWMWVSPSDKHTFFFPGCAILPAKDMYVVLIGVSKLTPRMSVHECLSLGAKMDWQPVKDVNYHYRTGSCSLGMRTSEWSSLVCWRVVDVDFIAIYWPGMIFFCVCVNYVTEGKISIWKISKRRHWSNRFCFEFWTIVSLFDINDRFEIKSTIQTGWVTFENSSQLVYPSAPEICYNICKRTIGRLKRNVCDRMSQ